VLIVVASESIGIPFPDETMLLAAIDTGTTHHLFIPFVIAAAAIGTILGDNVGFWIGREGGYRLLRRYDRYDRIDVRTMKLGSYLFRTYGGTVVFFGRFVAVLRALAAFIGAHSGAYTGTVGDLEGERGVTRGRRCARIRPARRSHKRKGDGSDGKQGIEQGTKRARHA